MPTIRWISLALTVAICIGLTWLAGEPIPQPLVRKAQTYRYFSQTQDQASSGSLNTTLIFSSGELQLQPGSTAYKFAAWTPYPAPKPRLTYQEIGKAPGLQIQQPVRPTGLSPHLWQIELGSEIRHSVQLLVKESDQTLDFTGIPVKDLNIEGKDATIKLTCLTQNPIQMRQFLLSASETNTQIFGLINFNAVQSTIHQDGGTLLLNCAGPSTQARKILLTGGVDQLILQVPKAANLLIDYLADQNLPGFKPYGETGYVQTHFDPNKPVIQIMIHTLTNQLTVQSIL